MDRNLEEGDVFEIEKGMNIYASIPEKFIYNNKLLSNKKTNTHIVVGKKFINSFSDKELKPLLDTLTKKVQGEFTYIFGEIISKKEMFKILLPTFEKIKPILKKRKTFNTSSLIGEYVVIKTSYEGGGTGHGPGDVYPDGHRVIATKLQNGKWKKEGEEISFYQSGCFTAMINPMQIALKRKMEIKFE